MKNTIIFIAGVVVGVVCLYAWQGYQFQRITMNAPISQLSLGDDEERKTFTVTYDKPVRVDMIHSDEVYTLTLTRLANGNIGYSWKSTGAEASSGDGELFEKYDVVAKTPSARHVKDVGSSLRIELGGDKLTWSEGSGTSGHIYYNPSRMQLAHKSKD